MEPIGALLPAFVPRPASGRVFTPPQRAVRSTDATSTGRLRLDAVARYLQEAAEDDLADARLREPHVWLVRRFVLAIRGWPRLGDRVSLATFCSGTGPRWAERTTTLTGPGGAGLIQSVAIWVAVTRADGRPAPLSEAWHRVYAPSAGGRTVSSRLSLPAPPASLAGRPWPLRSTDFDTAGHVNNSVHWAAAEDALATQDWLPSAAQLEYHRPVLPGAQPDLLTASGPPGQLSAWLQDGPTRLASIHLAR
jgi:acyl-ACP thioesterase